MEEDEDDVDGNLYWPATTAPIRTQNVSVGVCVDEDVAKPPLKSSQVFPDRARPLRRSEGLQPTVRVRAKAPQSAS